MKPLKFLQWAWPVEVAILIIAWLIIVFFVPAKMEPFIKPMPFMLTFIGAQASAAFGGRPLKTKLENSRLKNATSEGIK